MSTSRTGDLEVVVHATVADLAAALADRVADLARRADGPLLLGVPAGRTVAPVVPELATRLRAERTEHLVLVLMDVYLVGGRLADPDAHYSCRRFGLAAAAALGLAPERVWTPDPADPASYDRRIADAGGIELFLVAVGATDGHVAFNPPGTPLESRTRVVEIADTTRADNLGTFPEFGSLDDVAHGAAKASVVRRILDAPDFDPDWPATFVHRHPDVRVHVDAAASTTTRGIPA